MVEIDSPPPGFEAFAGTQVFTHGHLPLAAAYCRHLGLVELVNQLVPTRMGLKPGLVVQAMVLDTLSGRTPLYRLEEFLAGQDVELLLDEKVDAHAFNDTNLGRSLDAIFEAGPSKILTALGVRAVETFLLDAHTVSYDTTSTNVWGDYRACESETPPKGPVITRGHSKDKRPDLKQFMTELLCVERGIPIFGRVLDGNSSDKTSNNRILTNIGKLMAKHGFGPGAFTYVADSAMVTKDNLEALGENRFVSRLPANYSACGNVVENAVDCGNWTDIGHLSENNGTTNRPAAVYKTCESTVELHGKTYRAVVLHSNSYDKRRKKKLEKAVAESERQLASELNRTVRIYHCQADALEAAKRVGAFSGKLHHIETTVIPFQVRRRGRPPKNGPAPTVTKYELQWKIVANSEAVQRERTLAGCFVLVSNVPSSGDDAVDAAGLLKVYKGQYGVESNFAFLKDPLVVNDIFLKMPHRIDALGMVLVMALLVWRLMERTMRASVQNTGETLPGWENRRTLKPTTFMMTTAMSGITVLVTKGGNRFIMRKPRPRQDEYLTALGLDHSVFTNPSFKCTPIIPENNVQKK